MYKVFLTSVSILLISIQLRTTAPSGVLPLRQLLSAMAEYSAQAVGNEQLPALWCSLTSAQWATVASALSASAPAPREPTPTPGFGAATSQSLQQQQMSDVVNWRALLLLLAEPWPRPTTAQLLDALAVFRELDQLRVGYLTREQYDFVGTGVLRSSQLSLVRGLRSMMGNTLFELEYELIRA